MIAKDEIFVLIAVWRRDVPSPKAVRNERQYGVARYGRCERNRTQFEITGPGRNEYWKSVRSGDVELWSGSVEELMLRCESAGIDWTDVYATRKRPITQWRTWKTLPEHALYPASEFVEKGFRRKDEL